MRVVIQRVAQAKVRVQNEIVGQIERGLVVLLGVGHHDSESDVDWLVNKVVNQRIFNDAEGVMNLSLKDCSGDLMVISQFTLMATTKKGHRPSYMGAAPHQLAIPLYESFCEKAKQMIDKEVARGVFAADMQVELINDGPVTIVMDSKSKE